MKQQFRRDVCIINTVYLLLIIIVLRTSLSPSVSTREVGGKLNHHNKQHVIVAVCSSLPLVSATPYRLASRRFPLQLLLGSAVPNPVHPSNKNEAAELYYSNRSSSSSTVVVELLQYVSTKNKTDNMDHSMQQWAQTIDTHAYKECLQRKHFNLP